MFEDKKLLHIVQCGKLYYDLAEFELSRKNLPKALYWIEESLKVRESKLKKYHPDV